MSLLTQVFALLVVATVAVGGTSVYFKLHNNGNAEPQTAAVAATTNEPVFIPPENNADENATPEVKNTPAASTEVKTAAKTETKPQTPKVSSVIPGKITAYITDQYGNTFGGSKFYSGNAHFELFDSLGELVFIPSYVQNGAFETKELPPGKYTLYVPGRHDAIYVTPTVKTFSLPAEGINLGHITVMRWAKVSIKITNEAGTQLSYPKRLFVKCDISDQYVKEVEANRMQGAPGLCSDSGLPQPMGTLILPAGTYIIKFSHDGYVPIEKTFTVGNQDVDLGTITLKKQ